MIFHLSTRNMTLCMGCDNLSAPKWSYRCLYNIVLISQLFNAVIQITISRISIPVHILI
jgi:hypothetical protein